MNIDLRLSNGDTVIAEVIGQMGLHENFMTDDDSIRVTHISSGCLLAIFSDYDDACEFSAEAQELLDFDMYAQFITVAGINMAKMMYHTQIGEVHKLRDSYITYMHDLMPNVYATRETLIKFTKNSHLYTA